MKHLLYILCALCLFSCTDKDKFVVKGTTSQERLNGELVFLVPFGSKQLEDSIGVDSVVIKNGKFEFKGNRQYMARVSLHKDVRYGTQDLLIVTEPGKINVHIDSVSYGGGTPQNDAMQQWKDLKAAHDAATSPQVILLHHYRLKRDSAMVRSLTDTLKTINDDYRNKSLQIADKLGAGPAHDFIKQRFGVK